MLDYDTEVGSRPVPLTALPQELRFRDVETPLDGVVSDGRALTRFLPQGYATPTLIHLEDDEGAVFTVEVRPVLGRAEVFDERVEWD